MPKFGALEYTFVALMLATGFGVAAIAGRNPALESGTFPPIIWPVGAALVFDIVTTLLRGGGMPPLAMPIRAAGVVLAMALYAMLVGRI